MRLYLGIDGGGTGCRAALADADGRVIGRGEAAAANIWTDPEGALGNILDAARAAMAEARLEADLLGADRGAGAGRGQRCPRRRRGWPGGCPSRGRGSRATRWSR